MDNNQFYAGIQHKLELAADRGDFGWLGGVMAILAILFIYSQVAIGYTHGSLVGTLAMVEDTNPTAVIRSAATTTKDGLPAYTDEPDAPPPAYAREEVLLLAPKPITSSNRGTVKHLKATCGRGARFRGLGLAIVYALGTHWVSWGIYGVFGLRRLGMCGASLSFVAAQLLLWRVNMLWTHVVISAPSDTRLSRRFIPMSSAKKALLPTLGWALAHIAIPCLLIALLKVLGTERLVHKLDTEGKLRDVEVVMLAGGALLTVAVAALLMLVIYVPASVALTRVHAALLADTETPVVPLDRTFNGSLLAQNRRLRLKDAWRSFDWNARMRLAKVYLKTVCFQVASALAFGALTFVAMTVWVVVA